MRRNPMQRVPPVVHLSRPFPWRRVSKVNSQPDVAAGREVTGEPFVVRRSAALPGAAIDLHEDRKWPGPTGWLVDVEAQRAHRAAAAFGHLHATHDVGVECTWRPKQSSVADWPAGDINAKPLLHRFIEAAQRRRHAEQRPQTDDGGDR